MKRCNACGCEWPATEEFYYASKQSLDGWRPTCKICILDKQQIYYINNLTSERNRKRMAYRSRLEQSPMTA